ncbi:MAG: hypothetical protein CVV27_01575 [Candidatus Melainabacteria bacterium HGW-Melainabacteria-1]|nr:MAG: hypothetical protein CVV27_01575 [Candidatus Melainabacteria bacterium HGW-Melainabacteria-1]
MLIKTSQVASLLLTVLLSVSCAQEDTKPSDEGATETKTESESNSEAAKPDEDAVVAEGFSIVPPDGWEKGDADGNTFMVYLDAPKDNFRANFNVNSSKDDGVPIDKLAELLKPAMAKQFEGYQAVEDGKTELNGAEAYFLSGRFKTQGHDIQNLQYYIRGKQNRFYVLTFTAPAASYASYEPIFKEAAETVTAVD